ncbi:MAG: inorganic pyrophosphatase [Myxococcota bacterium]
MNPPLVRSFKAHPWHGVPIGRRAPDVVTTFIEMTPSDTVKFEIDKTSGYLWLDRPQKYSNVCPALYGFVPGTLCDTRVAARCRWKDEVVGDQDPLDILVLTEKQVIHGDILLESKPIGGFRMIDGGEADDKIVAVLEGDFVYGEINELHALPKILVDRLQHYFLTYKTGPNDTNRSVEIVEVYDRAEARAVVKASEADYNERFGEAHLSAVKADLD